MPDFPASGAAQATPLYPDARNVYAIVPSYEAPVAAYDPVYAQLDAARDRRQRHSRRHSRKPPASVRRRSMARSANRSICPACRACAAGTYVLLPAKYATLPGAYRVVQNTGASNVVPGQSVTLPDGTHLVSGYYVDALTGARSAIPVQFQVQSAAVWGQYSQYTRASANTYFATQAAEQWHGDATAADGRRPPALAATANLFLDTTLEAAAAPGGLPAEVDIASQDIEIVGQGEQALAGYLQLPPIVSTRSAPAAC